MKYKYLHFKALKLTSPLRYPCLMTDKATFFKTHKSCYFDTANPPNQTFDYMNKLNRATKANDPRNQYNTSYI